MTGTQSADVICSADHLKSGFNDEPVCYTTDTVSIITSNSRYCDLAGDTVVTKELARNSRTGIIYHLGAAPRTAKGWQKATVDFSYGPKVSFGQTVQYLRANWRAVRDEQSDIILYNGRQATQTRVEVNLPSVRILTGMGIGGDYLVEAPRDNSREDYCIRDQDGIARCGGVTKMDAKRLGRWRNLGVMAGSLMQKDRTLERFNFLLENMFTTLSPMCRISGREKC